ncbi:unnamed protein product, partial [Ceratitis capitata]
MLDIMALVSFVICKEMDGLHKHDARRSYLNTLDKSLVLANVENRMNNPKVISQFTTRVAVESFFGKPINIAPNLLTMHRSGADTLTNKRETVVFVYMAKKNFDAKLISY